MRLNGRVALVTGSSRGIGAAIAGRLAADGAQVVVHASKNADNAKEVAHDIREAGGSAEIVLGDVAAGDNSAQVVRDAFAVHGALDILVCNAGAPLSGSILEQDDATIDANLA